MYDAICGEHAQVLIEQEDAIDFGQLVWTRHKLYGVHKVFLVCTAAHGICNLLQTKIGSSKQCGRDTNVDCALEPSLRNKSGMGPHVQDEELLVARMSIARILKISIIVRRAGSF